MKALVEKIQRFNWTIPEEFFKDYLWPVLLSFISAIIFWFFFSILPYFIKRRKIRPRIEGKLIEIYYSMIHIYESFLLIEGVSGRQQTDLLISGNMKRDDLKLSLQNKCINNNFLKDPIITPLLKPIGPIFCGAAMRMNSQIDYLFISNQYVNFLSTKEVILLENLKNQTMIYNDKFEKQPFGYNVQGQLVYPNDPSLSYLAHKFIKVYPLFLKLQKTVFKYNDYTNLIFLQRIRYYMSRGEYKKAKKMLKKEQFDVEGQDLVYIKKAYACKIQYHLLGKEKAYQDFDKIMKEKPHLVSSRDLVSLFLFDDKGIEIVNKYYSTSEVEELKAIIEKEKNVYKTFFENAKFLESYYNKS